MPGYEATQASRIIDHLSISVPLQHHFLPGVPPGLFCELGILVAWLAKSRGLLTDKRGSLVCPKKEIKKKEEKKFGSYSKAWYSDKR